MPDTRPSLLLDEDVWPGLAATLRERGFDAVSVHELDRGGLSDAEPGRPLVFRTESEIGILSLLDVVHSVCVEPHFLRIGVKTAIKKHHSLIFLA